MLTCVTGKVDRFGCVCALQIKYYVLCVLIILCYFTCIFYAVVRHISTLFIDNTYSVYQSVPCVCVCVCVCMRARAHALACIHVCACVIYLVMFEPMLMCTLFVPC